MLPSWAGPGCARGSSRATAPRQKEDCSAMSRVRQASSARRPDTSPPMARRSRSARRTAPRRGRWRSPPPCVNWWDRPAGPVPPPSSTRARWCSSTRPTQICPGSCGASVPPSRPFWTSSHRSPSPTTAGSPRWREQRPTSGMPPAVLWPPSRRPARGGASPSEATTSYAPSAPRCSPWPTCRRPTRPWGSSASLPRRPTRTRRRRHRMRPTPSPPAPR